MINFDDRFIEQNTSCDGISVTISLSLNDVADLLYDLPDDKLSALLTEVLCNCSNDVYKTVRKQTEE